jgi:hypothetical protein
VVQKSLSWLTSYPGGGALPMYDEAREALTATDIAAPDNPG